LQIIRELSDLNALRDVWRSAGEDVALVPTMGALHQGHLDLVTASRRIADRVIATIFINPMQFNDPADLAAYPRTEQADIAKLEASGCDAVWIPTAEQLYPPDFATTVSVAGVSERWEGAHRPDHFLGVATVVAKLFIAAMPDWAVFGEKDWQQLQVIKRMTADLGLPIRVHGYPTVRDPDGLAMSSRNARLGPDERKQALALPRTLETAAKQIAAGKPVRRALAEAKQALVDAGFLKIDYVALVDAATLEPLSEPAGEMRLIAAATIGGTRLIDNVALK
jgi:pantoate--beta-alanine ligase